MWNMALSGRRNFPSSTSGYGTAITLDPRLAPTRRQTGREASSRGSGAAAVGTFKFRCDLLLGQAGAVVALDQQSHAAMVIEVPCRRVDAG